MQESRSKKENRIFPGYGGVFLSCDPKILAFLSLLVFSHFYSAIFVCVPLMVTYFQCNVLIFRKLTFVFSKSAQLLYSNANLWMKLDRFDCDIFGGFFLSPPRGQSRLNPHHY